MFHVLGCIYHQHDLRLVALASVLCVASCSAAMAMLSRAWRADGSTHLIWIVCAGSSAGFGIWATHFIGMLAYESVLPIAFDPLVTVESILIAVVMCGGGFALSIGRTGPILGGAITGAAISAMHYVGMSAVRAPADLLWNLHYVAASVFVGVGLMSFGMWLAVRRWNLASYLAGAAIFTLAICGMHFTGMTALTLRPDPGLGVFHSVIAPETLAVAIAAAAFLVIGVGLAGTLFDRQKRHMQALQAAKENLEQLSEDLKAALVEAQSAGKAKATFFAAMSHELRTPLNAIIGFSEMLQNETFGPVGHARNAEYIRDIHASGARLLSIVNNVLDISRMDAGKMTLSESEFAAADLIASEVKLVARQASEAGVTLAVAEFSGELRLRGDRAHLEQALLNLLANAVKFTPSGGRIDVGVFLRDDWVDIEVADTGIGIAPDDLDRVMEPFVQADSRLARKYEGTGLGLAIARKLMELHGGKLLLRSELQKGTTATLRLPIARAVAAPLETAA